MRRRSFITLVGGAAAVWPLTARAQSTKTIGFIVPTTQGAAKPWVAAFEQRLRELGWMEGRKLVIAYRWAEGRNERMAEIADEFVRDKVDVIVAQGTQAAQAAKKATNLVPTVFTLPGDPVGSGLVTPQMQRDGLSHLSHF